MTDLELIGQIEEKLIVKLYRLNEITWYSRGYTLNPSGQVTGLGLYDCGITNLKGTISFISGLTNLTYLSLSKNQVMDISSLKGLTNLTYLNLSRNQISDISTLIPIRYQTLIIAQ